MRRPRPASLQRETSTSGSLVPPVPFSGWLDPPTLSTSSTQSTSSSTGGKLVDMFTKLIFQLIFWPLTLGMMLAGPAYRLLLQFGCSSSPLSFRDPPRWLVRLASKPFRWVNPPVTLGIESLERCLRAHAKRRVEHGEGQEQVEGRKNPPRPILLVGNLTLLGLDCLPLLNEVQGRTGVYPRVLYDTLLGYLPGWKQLAEAAGGVKGTMGNCEALMSEGRCLLLYPGGAREAFKGGDEEKYRLLWNEKLGFARMAVKHGYAVVPFASVGLEDAVSIAFGFDVTWIARKAEPGRGPLRLPILLPYNSLQRQYFAFGEPIETAHFGGDWESLAKCTEVYTRVKGEVEKLIQRLQHVQEKDPDRFILSRVLRGCLRMLGGLGAES
ncbi:unnamed protein product [Ascophyllum nodosum]